MYKKMYSNEVLFFRDTSCSSYSSNRGCHLIYRPPSQLLDCRSKSSVGEKKGRDDCCNVNDKAISAERGVALLDLIGNAEIAEMMDELREDLEMERAKCRGL